MKISSFASLSDKSSDNGNETGLKIASISGGDSPLKIASVSCLKEIVNLSFKPETEAIFKGQSTPETDAILSPVSFLLSDDLSISDANEDYVY